MIYLSSLVITLITFFAPPQSERERVFIDNSNVEFLLAFNDIPVMVDSTNNMTFEQVLFSQKQFSVTPGFKPKDYCTSCTYWVKIPLLVANELNHEWMVEFYDQTIDEITAYFPNEDNTYYTDKVGDFQPFNEKPFLHKNFQWIVDTNIKGQQNLYFRVRSHSYADVRISIRTVNEFVGYALNEYFLYGIFYGMIFIVGVYNLLIYFAIREIKYIYYCLYIISVGVYAMCVDGIAYQYLWPSWPQWNQIAYGAALFSLIFWSLLFSRRFLNLSVRSPRLYWAINWTIILRTALFVYGLIFNHRLFEYRNIEIIPLSLIFYCSIRVWSKGYKPARFFVVAYGILFLGFLTKALIFLSVIPLVTISYYSLHISFLLEMVFLTFALSDRVRILKDNRDRAQNRIIRQQQENAELKDKVNKELEEKIKERTQQLEEKNLLLADTNQKLEEQTKEINALNSKLDLDNWKLKNNIQEILQDRLINKNLTLEQFQKIFPDEPTCYRFLEKLKWGTNYHCIKCGNDKYHEGKTKFMRRCTKCGYNESVTSNTIFHRIKFPIEKAFFILYITNNKRKEYTLDQLSEMLDLRRNTVWNFKKKIEKVYDSENGKSSTALIHNFFNTHLGDN
ncbi:7TM diverse intracellular signaling domain-containing protein [Roseivirga pacifica]|uniref:7TM diverse intracellular signaling domain-containing protein n=1 Tax=Roseivirga pacifica TaxID=1267423 RepID=UPI003BAAD303